MTFARKAAKYANAALVCFGFLFAVGCGDVYRPIADPITNPGGDPQNREIDAIINTNPSGGFGSATFFDVAGDTNVGNVSAGNGVTRASFDLFNQSLYIPNPDSNNVTYIFRSYSSSGIATATKKMSITPEGLNPRSIFPSSSSMYTMNAGNGTSVCPSVGVIDIASQTHSGNIALTDSALAPIPAPQCFSHLPKWAAFANSQNTLFVVDSGGNSVYAIYAPQNSVRAVIPVGTNPVWAGLSLNGNYLFVVNQGSNDISVIDVNTLAVVGTPVATGGTAPVYGYLDRKLDRFYVVNQGSETVSAFNSANPLALVSLHAPAPTGPVPAKVTATSDGTRLYVPNTGSNTVTEIDTGSFITKTIQVSTDATVRVTDAGVAKLADPTTGSKLYVNTLSVDDMSNQTVIIRTGDDSIILSLPAPRQDMSTCQVSGSNPCQPIRQRPMQLVGTN